MADIEGQLRRTARRRFPGDVAQQTRWVEEQLKIIRPKSYMPTAKPPRQSERMPSSRGPGFVRRSDKQAV